MTSPSKTAPTRFVGANGTRFAYRRYGEPTGTPIVLLQHFMGNLDSYDPAITDSLSMGREVILTDNAGVGLSTGTAPDTVAAAQPILFPDSNHGSHVQSTKLFNRYVTDFVDR